MYRGYEGAHQKQAKRHLFDERKCTAGRRKEVEYYIITVCCLSAVKRALSRRDGFYVVLGRSYRATFFSKFSSFCFQEKQEEQGKQETFPKFRNLTGGKIFGRLRIPIFGRKKKRKIWKYKNCAKKKSGNLDIKSFDKNGPYFYSSSFSFFLFSSHELSSPFFFSLPPSRNSDAGSYGRLFSPHPHYDSRLAFLSQEDFSSFFPRRLASILRTTSTWVRTCLDHSTCVRTCLDHPADKSSFISTVVVVNVNQTLFRSIRIISTRTRYHGICLRTPLGTVVVVLMVLLPAGMVG